MTFAITITKKGLEECISAKDQGFKAKLKWISVGDQAYTPNPDQEQLRNETQREAISQKVDVGPTSVNFAAKFSGDDEYPVREIAYWLESGTLLGVTSSPNTTLNYKAAKGHMILPFTLDLSVLPTDSVEVVVGVENLNILIDPEMMMDAVSFIRSQVVQVKQACMNMQLSEKLRESQGIIKQLQGELIATTQRLDEKVSVQREQLENEIEAERMSDMEIFICSQTQQIKQAETNLKFDERLRNVESR